MSKLKSTILVLGASSFLTKPLIKNLEYENLFEIICQSRSDIKDSISTNSDITFLRINYEEKKYELKIFQNCDYIINFVNASELNQYEILNFRRFLEHVLTISNPSLIHISFLTAF